MLILLSSWQDCLFLLFLTLLIPWLTLANVMPVFMCSWTFPLEFLASKTLRVFFIQVNDTYAWLQVGSFAVVVTPAVVVPVVVTPVIVKKSPWRGTEKGFNSRWRTSLRWSSCSLVCSLVHLLVPPDVVLMSSWCRPDLYLCVLFSGCSILLQKEELRINRSWKRESWKREGLLSLSCCLLVGCALNFCNLSCCREVCQEICKTRFQEKKEQKERLSLDLQSLRRFLDSSFVTSTMSSLRWECSSCLSPFFVKCVRWSLLVSLLVSVLSCSLLFVLVVDVLLKPLLISFLFFSLRYFVVVSSSSSFVLLVLWLFFERRLSFVISAHHDDDDAFP